MFAPRALSGEEKAEAARERREEETDEEAAEPAQADAGETGEAEASSMGYEAVMPHEEARVIVSMLHTRPPHPAHMLRI